MPYSKKTIEAFRKYTQDGCIRAYQLNRQRGEGASTIALQFDIPNVNTTQAADAAINAGAEFFANSIAL